MCGIAGFWQKTGSSDGQLQADAARMADCIQHRGPDDSGVWTRAEWGLALAHRRLSILDLSPAGAQPMRSASGRYVIVYNGEIYNFAELRAELNIEWRGHSDTEVILALLDQHGIENTLGKLNGMFAFAVVDLESKKLFLARDRFGEKPLYYGWSGDVFLFGSELKSLKAHGAWQGDIERAALAGYFRHNCIPQDQSIYTNVRKLLPGFFLSLDCETGLQALHHYWSARGAIDSARAHPLLLSFDDAAAALDEKLKQIVKSRMVSDVPLGAFLSGGIDSSVVAALMQTQSAQPVKTFSIGFAEDRYNEAPHAKEIAQYLQTDHTEFYVSAEDALNIIPDLPHIYDEPFADSSQIPTVLLSHLARQHVTVALTGDAGDEIFGGYNRYSYGASLWRKMKIVPQPLRQMAGAALQTLSPEQWNNALPFLKHQGAVGDKIHKIARALPAGNQQELYRNFLTHWQDNIVIGAGADSAMDWDSGLNFTENMIAHDLTHYLPDDILTKVDRASMSASLETRVPFLDPDLLHFVWQLSLSYRVQNNQGKIILKAVLEKYAPRSLFERPKMGFGVPIGDWLRGPLRDWAEDLLDEGKMQQEAYLNPAPVRKKWQEHLSGRHNWQHHLWDVLMFQSWLRTHR